MGGNLSAILSPLPHEITWNNWGWSKERLTAAFNNMQTLISTNNYYWVFHCHQSNFQQLPSTTKRQWSMILELHGLLSSFKHGRQVSWFPYLFSRSSIQQSNWGHINRAFWLWGNTVNWWMMKMIRLDNLADLGQHGFLMVSFPVFHLFYINFICLRKRLLCFWKYMYCKIRKSLWARNNQLLFCLSNGHTKY